MFIISLIEEGSETGAERGKEVIITQLFKKRARLGERRETKGVREMMRQRIRKMGYNQSPKGIIWSAVPLPCFFAVVRSQRIAGQ